MALFLDGKSFADTMMVVALGITIDGRKQPLGFVETTTENKRTLAEFLQSLIARGLDVSEGILVVIDGAKGSGPRYAKRSRGERSSVAATGTSGRTW